MGIIYALMFCNGGKDLTCLYRKMNIQYPKTHQVYKCERRDECKWITIHPQLPENIKK
jgi:hypothetical protein